MNCRLIAPVAQVLLALLAVEQRERPQLQRRREVDRHARSCRSPPPRAGSDRRRALRSRRRAPPPSARRDRAPRRCRRRTPPPARPPPRRAATRPPASGARARFQCRSFNAASFARATRRRSSAPADTGVGRKLDGVHRQALEQRPPRLAPPAGTRARRRPPPDRRCRTTSVSPVSGSSISMRPTLGSASSSGSPTRHRDQIVAARGDAQRPLVAGDRRQKVGDQERHRLPPHDVARGTPAPRRATSAGSSRLERQDLADDAQDVLLALLGRHELLDLVGEDDEADAIVVPDRRERQHRRQLGRQTRASACTREPNRPEADMSTSSSTVISRSSVNSLT